jgi:ketosteroid isomerase-like protein
MPARLALVGLVVAFLIPTASTAQASSPEELLDRWVALWGSYDLAPVADLFVRDQRLTYFSSEYEGVRKGFETIMEHHRSLDFVDGGDARDQVIWVGDVDIATYGASALITAIWYFGDQDAPDGAQLGPMTLLAVREDDGWRIGHMHFATYPGS